MCVFNFSSVVFDFCSPLCPHDEFRKVECSLSFFNNNNDINTQSLKALLLLHVLSRLTVKLLY